MFLVVAVLLGLAWNNRTCLDDAFITFRYADNLVHGKGLVFNEGERVEGYTNFLWALLMAGGIRLGLDPIPFSQVLGMVAFVGSLLCTYRMATLILDSEWLGMLAVALLGTNYTFLAFATGGIETSLQACLLTASVYAILHSVQVGRWALGNLVGLSLLLGLAVLTRPDSALFGFMLFPVVILMLWEESPWPVGKVVALVLPFVLLNLPWLVWKSWYYGDVLPNTFYAKSVGSAGLSLGAHYVALFLRTYTFWPFILLTLIALPIIISEQNELSILIVLILAWTAYVIWVGGDYMEFRFMVPILPLLMVTLTWLATRYVRQRGVQVFLLATVFLGSLNHAHIYGSQINAGPIEPMEQLQAHVWEHGWADGGRVLGATFGPESEVIIATTAAGAIPYYSGLKTIDMLGLTDRWVARYGADISAAKWPGHRRAAPIAYLVDRGVHLVIANPKVVKAHSVPYCIEAGYLTPLPGDKLPPGTTMIEIPLSDGQRTLLAFYLTRSPEVDRAIARDGWASYPCSD